MDQTAKVERYRGTILKTITRQMQQPRCCEIEPVYSEEMHISSWKAPSKRPRPTLNNSDAQEEADVNNYRTAKVSACT